MNSRFAMLACALALVGCQEIMPPPPDGGTITVPGTYHLARMTPGHREHLALKGDQKVDCRNCHAIADAGFVSPPVSICINCHEKQERQHHPLDAGTTELTCLTCHVFKAEEPGVRFEQWACMNCHREAQGEKKAIDVHVERCASCHRPHEAPFTAPADCTTCHDVSLKHGTKGDSSVAESCMACHAPHTKAPLASTQCLSCHEKPTMTAAARVVPEALFPKGHEGCGSCHTAHTFQKGAVKACVSCHKNQLVLAPDSHKCVDCHQPHQKRAEPKACKTCHQKVETILQHPASEEGKTCTGCHVPHPKEPGPIAQPCVSCHQKLDVEVVHAVSTTCDSCHVTHKGAPKRAVLCVTCHEDQVKAVRLNEGHAKCDNCHEGLPHAEAGEPKPCLSCHKDKTPPQAGHKECASCHASHSAKVTKTCVSCHLAPDKAPLPGLHAVQKHRECATCHAPHTPEPNRGLAACKTCHTRLLPASHPTPPTQCVGCHLFKKEK